MCFPCDKDELLRIQLMGKTMDAVFNAIENPKPKKHLVECEECSNSYIPRYYGGIYICPECREEYRAGDIEAAYERSHRMGPI